MRAIQGHSGGIKVDPTLLDNVEIPLHNEQVPLITSVVLPLYAVHPLIRTGCSRRKMQKKEGKQYSLPLWMP